MIHQLLIPLAEFVRFLFDLAELEKCLFLLCLVPFDFLLEMYKIVLDDLLVLGLVIRVVLGYLGAVGFNIHYFFLQSLLHSLVLEELVEDL